jgi:flagellar biosynthesis protein FliR
MNGIAGDLAYAFVLVFCRIGCCLMLLPVFGSARIAMRIRLMVALAATLSLAAFLLPDAQAALRLAGGAAQPLLLGHEALNGTLLGLLARAYVLALQFAGTLATNVIGLAPTPGAPVDDLEPSPPLVTLITLAAAMVILAARLDVRMLGALLQSYALVPLGAPFDAGWYLDQLLEKLGLTWSLGLQLAAPFVVYSVVVNLAIGFANKMTPQISVYFMTTGLVAAGGLILFWMIADDMYGVFLQEFLSFIG